MNNDEVYIPWILRSKFLRKNKNYFFLIVISSFLFFIIMGIKAGISEIVMRDPIIYFYFFLIIYGVLGTNFIIEKFIKLFNIDIYNGKRLTDEESEDFRKIKNLFKIGEIENYQYEFLKFICNKNEKLVVLFGVSILLLFALFNDIFIMKWFGAMYGNVKVYPYTFMGTIVYIYLFNFLFMSSLLWSLAWVFLKIITGINFLVKTQDLRPISHSGSLNEDDMISFSGFEYSFRPISDFIWLMSSFTIALSLLITIGFLYMNMKSDNTGVLFLSFIVDIIGLIIVIWPQIVIHKKLKNAKEKILFNYYQLYERKKKEYINTIENPLEEDAKSKGNFKEHLSIIKDLIKETEKIDTLPFHIRSYKLIGTGLSQLIFIFLNIYGKNIF